MLGCASDDSSAAGRVQDAGQQNGQYTQADVEYYCENNGYQAVAYQYEQNEGVYYGYAYYETDEPYYASDETPDVQMLPNFSMAVVQRVIDGDTIVLTCGERVRFIGIDAPEMGFHGGVYEAGATEATQFVRDKIDGQTIWLEASGNDRDRFDRLRRYIWIEKPTDPRDPAQIQTKQLNAMLLYHGLAVPFIVSGNQTTQTQQTTPPSETFGYIGNRNSQVFHIPTCNSLPAPHNRIYFDTRADAEAAGHRACSRCL